MKMKYFAPLFLTLTLGLASWNSSSRISNSLEYEVKVEKDIEYGSAEGYRSSYPYDTYKLETIIPKVGAYIYSTMKDHISLELDLYYPKSYSSKKFPLIVMAHDGALQVGDKGDPTMVSLGNYFAKNGYVTASINYRIGFPLSSGMFEKALYNGTQDMRAAIRFLVEYADDYQIDKNKIYVLGASAGGFVALSTAFLEESERPKSTSFGMFNSMELECLDCSTNFFETEFKINGVINLWGAVQDLNYIDRHDNCGILSVHGSEDDIVPMNYDFPFQRLKVNNPILRNVYSEKVYGSDEIHKHASRIGLKSEIKIYPNSKHSPHLDFPSNTFNSKFGEIKKECLKFLKSN